MHFLNQLLLVLVSLPQLLKPGFGILNSLIEVLSFKQKFVDFLTLHLKVYEIFTYILSIKLLLNLHFTLLKQKLLNYSEGFLSDWTSHNFFPFLFEFDHLFFVSIE